MKNFNIITDNLHTCAQYVNYYIIGKRGDEKKMQDRKKNWNSGDNTEAQVLIYDYKMDVIMWKNVKRSSKGLFINLRGKRVYLSKFKHDIQYIQMAGRALRKP